MKRGHDDDYEDQGQKRGRGDGKVELRFLLASKVRHILTHLSKYVYRQTNFVVRLHNNFSYKSY